MTAKPFTTRLDTSVKTRLEAIAQREDRSASYLAKKAITDFVEKREYDHDLITRAREQIANGQGVPEEKIDAWMEEWANIVESPFPNNS